MRREITWFILVRIYACSCKACAANCPGNAIKMEDNKAQVVKNVFNAGIVAICR